MLVKKLTFAVVTFAFAFTGIAAHAQEAGALLDLLVRKRVITDQEAEEVRSELSKEMAATSAGKWKLSAPINEIELYADTRVRYEYRGGRTASNDPENPNDWLERKRARYRVRVGLRGTLLDDWSFGLRLETSSSNRSTNVTFGGDSSNGPFSKNDDGIFVGQAYIAYKGFPDITLTAGRMPQPLVTTSMLWDDDINPEGLAQQWKHTFNIDLGGGGGAVESYSKEGYSKDGKGVVTTQAAAEPFKLKIDVFANFAQFVYDDTNPENPIGPARTTDSNGFEQRVPTTDAYLLAWQVGARVTFPNNIYFQLAPTLYNYTGTGDTFNTFFQGDSPDDNQTGINSLLVLDIPVELGWKIGELPMRMFGEFAVNLEGDDRAAAAGHPGSDGQRYAYQAGLAVGQLKAKSDWEIRSWWQHTDQYSVDPNLVDSDIFDSRVNMQGVAVKAGYALADAIIFNLTWAYGWRSNGNFGTGGTGDIGINPLDQYQIFQADLNVKF
ncbi:MAG TPA: putative porin [Candidatus Baltobacteraceae bacterium]|nr:putative porin [Candidatus Baltobacteraceae bacterium]